MSPPMRSSRRSMPPASRGTNTRANRKNITPKMMSIQTIWPGHWATSNCGRPADCSTAPAATAVAVAAAIFALDEEDDEGDDEGEDAHGFGHGEAQEQHRPFGRRRCGIAHR